MLTTSSRGEGRLREIRVGDHFVCESFQALPRLFHCWIDVRHVDRIIGLVYGA